jgi:hypothetical protein
MIVSAPKPLDAPPMTIICFIIWFSSSFLVRKATTSAQDLAVDPATRWAGEE